MDFPVFSNNGEQVGDLLNSTGEHSPSGSTFAAPAEMPPPTIHDGRDAAHAEQIFRLRIELTQPQLLAAMDAQERTRREQEGWLQRYNELRAVIFAKENRMKQRVAAGDSVTAQQLRVELKALTAQQEEILEELTAAREEHESAIAEVARLNQAA